jgi:hypothetical protein
LYRRTKAGIVNDQSLIALTEPMPITEEVVNIRLATPPELEMKSILTAHTKGLDNLNHAP